MKYILTITAKRKDAKRHIARKSNSIDDLRTFGRKNLNDCYKVDIYTGDWKLIENVK